MSHHLLRFLAGITATVSLGLNGLPAGPVLPLPENTCTPGGGGGGGGGGGFSIDDFMMWDGTGGGSASIPVRTPTACEFSRLLKFETWDITAKAGEDFVGVVQGTMVFPAGETTAHVRIEILGDNKYEGTETFGVRLTDGGTFEDPEAIVTLKDH